MYHQQLKEIQVRPFDEFRYEMTSILIRNQHTFQFQNRYISLYYIINQIIIVLFACISVRHISFSAMALIQSFAFSVHFLRNLLQTKQ